MSSTILPGHKKTAGMFCRPFSLHEERLLTAPLGVCMHAPPAATDCVVPEMEFRGVVARAFLCAAGSAAVPSTQNTTWGRTLIPIRSVDLAPSSRLQVSGFRLQARAHSSPKPEARSPN